MDIRCKNCGQMIDEKDKYCRYCGYLIPEPEPEVTLTEQEAEDKVQEEKATITEAETEGAALFNVADIRVSHIGDKRSVYMRNLLITIGVFVIAAAMLAVALVSKYVNMDDTVALILLLISMFCMIGALGIATERLFNTRAIHNIREDRLTVRKYGFVKPAEFLIDGHIFVVEPICKCSMCKGDIIGDLHIERIDRVPVVVCNMNRKHYWVLDEEAIINGVKAGDISVADKSKKSGKKSK